MPTKSKPTSVRPNPQRVYVAIYEHPHGTDVHVFACENLAMRWRTALAREWWSHAFDDDPPPDDEIGDAYFDRMLERDEFFSTVICDVETVPDAFAEPSPPGGP